MTMKAFQLIYPSEKKVIEMEKTTVGAGEVIICTDRCGKSRTDLEWM